ncbi:ABC transporter substrate-binding protein [Bacillus sp. CGMCC 1.16607]|uniref:ABC transporter substrate-binding protein n=1 Tax=Bacillus sp. CGMCC 1.16607 TaxID=3351842 RepID=UPI00362BA135
MNIEQYYISLRKHFHFSLDGESFSVSMDELTCALSCTRRNVQLVLKKMVDKNFIQWQPGKGRGNQSQMTFLMPLNELILEKSKRLVLEGKLNEAWMLIENLQIQRTKYEFSEWLYLQLGFQQHSDEEDVLRFPFYRPVLDLDPTFVHRRTEAHIVNQIFNTLVSFDEKTRQITPELAHYWESNHERTVWRFYLRRGVRFHHGKLMSAEDIAYSFHRILNEASFDNIKSTLKTIKILGKHSLEFILHEPDVLFVHYLCSEKCSIIPSDLNEIQKSNSFTRYPIGTGPFQVGENNESVLTLIANDHYFEGRPHLDRIEMWIWPNYEENRMIRKLKEDDIYYGVFPVAKESHVQLESWEKGATYLSFNRQKTGPLQDEYLRSAIHFALNREKMIDELQIKGVPANSFFPEQSRKTYNSEANTKRARQLINDSNYRGESLQLYTYEMHSNEQNAKWIQQELRPLGIPIEIVILPIKEFTKQRVLESDLIVAGEVLGTQEDISLIEMFMYLNGFIYNHLGEEQRNLVKEFISLCKREEQMEKRIEYLNCIQESLKKDHSLLFLYHVQQTVMHNHSLQGMLLNSWGKVDYKNIWLKR